MSGAAQQFPGVTIQVEPGLNPLLPVGRVAARLFAGRVLEALGMEDSALDISLVGDAAIARLHDTFLGRIGPTNVLSFPDEDPERPAYIGQVALCVDAALREAFLYGQPPREHMVRLLAHGFLHLAGMDHGPEMDALTEAAVDALAEGEPA